jgi:hypothetical protein
VALLALRLRRSVFMHEFFSNQQSEESEIRSAVEHTLEKPVKPKSRTRVSKRSTKRKDIR